MNRREKLRQKIRWTEASLKQARDACVWWKARHDKAVQRANHYHSLLADAFPVMSYRYGENVPPEGYVPAEPSPTWVREASDLLGYSGCAEAKASDRA